MPARQRGMILLIYNQKMCREMHLPEHKENGRRQGAEYHIVLPGSPYGLPGEIALSLEDAEYGWKLHSTEQYKIIKDQIVCEEYAVREDDIFALSVVYGGILKVIAVGKDPSACTRREYDLTHMNELSIGRRQGNVIQYDFRNLISANHAKLRRYADGWYLSDTSRNGVFTDLCRVQGVCKMNEGETFHMFGLDLAMRGDTLSVKTGYGVLYVDERMWSAGGATYHTASGRSYNPSSGGEPTMPSGSGATYIPSRGGEPTVSSGSGATYHSASAGSYHSASGGEPTMPSGSGAMYHSASGGEPTVPSGGGAAYIPANGSWYVRTPRELPFLYEEEVSIAGMPGEAPPEQESWYDTIAPLLIMALPTVLGCGMALIATQMKGIASAILLYLGMMSAILSTLAGTLWMVIRTMSARREKETHEETRLRTYDSYLDGIEKMLRQKYLYNLNTLFHTYPPVYTCLSYGRETPGLWNRNQFHEDFLFQRLGTGDRPFQVRIRIPDTSGLMINDGLASKPAAIKEQFQTLRQAPVGIHLRKNQFVGLIGGAGKYGAVQMMHVIVAGAAAYHSYTDVKFVFLYEEAGDRRREWECMRWFPHAWSEDRERSYMAGDSASRRRVLAELEEIMRRRETDPYIEKWNGIPRPYYLVFLSDPSLLIGESIARYFYNLRPEYGVSVLMMTEYMAQMTNACTQIIENDNNFRGMYSLTEGWQGRKPIQFDQVSEYALEEMGRRMAEILVE